MADYVVDSLLSGVKTIFGAMPIACGYRLLESSFYGNDLHPFIFATGSTLIYNGIRIYYKTPKFNNSPGIFMGSAISYTLVDYLMRYLI